MELPRYQSRTLPTVAAESPASAGAGAAAMGQALQRGADVVADVTARISQAESESAADASLAEIQTRLSQFANDPRWQQPEVDGKPTDEVMGAEWEKLRKAVLRDRPKIRWRQADNDFQLRRKLLLERAAVDVSGQQRVLMVDRGKVLTDRTADSYAQIGNFTEARAAIVAGRARGLYSESEFAQRQAAVDKAEVAYADNGVAQELLATWRDDAEAGARALAAFQENDTRDPNRKQDIARAVLSGVEALRAERQAVFADLIVELERRIGSGAGLSGTLDAADELYRLGALTPMQRASYRERAYDAAERQRVASAGATQFMADLQSGLPLDPQNTEHRKYLDLAFRSSTQGETAGSPAWSAQALAFAGRARLLPGSAAAWLRQSARASQPMQVAQAAEFYGALRQTSPEAAESLDADTRAFLGAVNAMREAGATPQAAVETTRANQYHVAPEVVKQRREVYASRQTQTSGPAALNRFIAQDFDPGLFRSNPEATAMLSADFDRQAGIYFEKTGDIELARDLAWQDLRRVYGVSRVNGEPVVQPYPAERFGLTAEDVRADVAAALKAQGVTLDPADVLILPDAQTLRQGLDPDGAPVRPSYRLMTQRGELVTGANGVPLRYVIPGEDALLGRIREAEARAKAEAQAEIDKARRDRELRDVTRQNVERQRDSRRQGVEF